MNLRICESGHERIVPASVELVEQAFAPDALIGDGTEITLTEGDRWIAAVAVGAAGDAAEFLLTGAVGEVATGSSQAARPEALRRFREFVSANIGAPQS